MNETNAAIETQFGRSITKREIGFSGDNGPDDDVIEFDNEYSSENVLV